MLAVQWTSISGLGWLKRSWLLFSFSNFFWEKPRNQSALPGTNEQEVSMSFKAPDSLMAESEPELSLFGSLKVVEMT